MTGLAPSGDLPALHATHGGIWIAEGGATRGLGRGEAIARASATPTILLNAPVMAARLAHARTHRVLRTTKIKPNTPNCLHRQAHA